MPAETGKPTVVVLLGLLAASCGPGDYSPVAPLPRTGGASFRKMAADYRTRIEPVLARKCFNCHSAKTRYPWYYRVPGVKNMIDRDVKKGRRVIDMTDGFPFAGLGTAQERIEGLSHAVEDGSMPPLLYLIGNPRSKLSENERAMILEWISGTARNGGSPVGSGGRTTAAPTPPAPRTAPSGPTLP